MEEERRLCFVGITRAQQWLVLTKAQYRTIRGMRERTVPSPFLKEMSQEAMEVTDRTGLEFREGGPAERDEAGGFRKGHLVRHPMFGLGRIADINSNGARTVAIVDFNAVGRKTLVVEAARLELVG